MTLTVDPMPATLFKRIQGRVRTATKRAMRQAAIETKNELRGYLAHRLTMRAAYLLTHQMFDDDTTVMFHSRWFRRPRGAPQQNAKLNAHDILAAHAQPGGLIIRPARAQMLIVSNVRGKGARPRFYAYLKEELERRQKGARERLARMRTGRGGIALVRRFGKHAGAVIATLARSVRIPQRLDKAKMLAITRSVGLKYFRTLGLDRLKGASIDGASS